MEDYTLKENLVNSTQMPYYNRIHNEIKMRSIELLPDTWRFPEGARELLITRYSHLPELQIGRRKQVVVDMLWRYHNNNPIGFDLGYMSNSTDGVITDEEEDSIAQQTIRIVRGGMVNKKVKKCEKKKVVLGKERCIYKVSGSKKDYMKYKGELVPVTEYVKYMKKKN